MNMVGRYAEQLKKKKKSSAVCTFELQLPGKSF
jgi:hypothetical protein